MSPRAERQGAGAVLRRCLCLVVLGLALAGCDREAGGDAAERVADDAGPLDTAAASLPLEASIGASSVPESEPPVQPSVESADAAAARQVIEDYYGAIDAQDYERAYGYWGDEGRASGQTYLQFVAGFAATADVTVEVGQVGRIEGAAGSRYVEVPVVVDARRDDGERQRFEGQYTLRRAVVEGASAAQRRWHLHEASLRQVR